MTLAEFLLRVDGLTAAQTTAARNVLNERGRQAMIDYVKSIKSSPDD